MIGTILIVDDEARVREALADMLTVLGHQVQAAAGPEAAIDLVRRKSFSLAIVDNLLGSSKGIDLVERLGRVDPELSFVIMTGNPSLETAILAMKRGVADFLRKPFRAEDLLVSIDHVNRRRQLEQERKEVLRGLELKVREKTYELRQTYLSVLVSLSRTVEKRDLGTYGHSMRVAETAAQIAERLGLSREAINDIHAASLLHDIGKIGIGDSILGKTGPLNEEEREIVKSHPEKGVEIIKPLTQFASLLPGILHHHERNDGSGYPAGLSGEDIPLSARIISVADTYDAIVSSRPYRPAAAHERAIAELRAWSGRQFDPRIVEAFRDGLGDDVQLPDRAS